MSNVSACPSQEHLRKFALGDIAEADAESLEQHLDSCERCWETVIAEPRGDTLVDALRTPPLTKGADDVVEAMLSRIESLRFSSPPLGKGERGEVEATQAFDTPAVDGHRDTPTAGEDASSAPDDIDFLSPAEAPDELGRLGGYRVLKVLGSGGMGVVFVAEDPQLQRRVALKVMRPALAASKTAKLRFLREARLAAKIEHDHLVHIYQVGEDRGMPFLAMQLLKGESLEERLRKDEGGRMKDERGLGIAEAVRIAKQIAEGLSAAHEQGLIHRDIKPANVFLERKDEGGRMKDEKGLGSSFILPPSSFRVKILDFGLARAVEDDAHITASGMVAGTPAYMAPEQARAEAVDARTDLFSLGCVLYRMLTGRMPFRGTNTTSVLLSLATENPTPPCEVNAQIPRELSDFVMRLLAKKPEERPASAREVMERLAAIERQLQPKAKEETQLAEKSSSPALSTAYSVLSPQKTVAAATTTNSPRSVGPGRWLVAAALLLALVGGGWYVAQIIIRVPSEHGTLIVELFDETLIAEVAGKTVKITDPMKKEFPLELMPQDGKVVFKDLATGNVLYMENFSLKKGGVERIRASIETVHFARDPDRHIAEWVLQHAGHFGVWKGQTVKEKKDIPKEQFHIFSIVIGDEKITPVDLRKLKNLKELAQVYLVGRFTDDHLKPISELSNLKNLVINASQVTDGGLEHVKKLTNLQHLNVQQTKLTSAGVNRLAAVLPQCTIHSDHGLFGPRIGETTTAGPRLTYALQFDGKAGHVVVPRLVLPEGQPFTVEAYATPGRSEGTGSVIGLGTTPSGIYQWDSRLDPNSRGAPQIGMWIARHSDFQEGTKDHAVQVGQRVHLACVWDGKECRLYVQGRRQLSFPKAITPSKGDLRGIGIGARLSKDGMAKHFFDGVIDQVRISKVSRYDADFSPRNRLDADLDTLALYHFDEGQGDVLKDSSGNGHDGKIVGAKWVRVGEPGVLATGVNPSRFINSLGMQFALVPKGKAWLGGGGGKPGDKEVEFKDDFYLGVYEVTQEEWEKVIGANPSHHSRKWGGKDLVKDISDDELKRFPVEGISWNDCQVFLEALNQRDKSSGWVYRLPTEDEWEYACRGGPAAIRADHAFDFYLEKPTNQLLPDQANFKHDNRPYRTCKVGSFPPNRLGLHDMHGNVAEWCHDLLTDAKGMAQRPWRGGAYWFPAQEARAARRQAAVPTSVGRNFGLRVARVRAPVADVAAAWVLSIGGEVGVDGDKAWIKAAADLPAGPFRLTKIQCVGVKLTDDGLAACRGLRHLTFLHLLGGDSVTDAGLEHFKDCVGLEQLSLNQFHSLTNAALAHFRNCKELKHINLGNMVRVTDAGVAHLPVRNDLNELHLTNLGITDAALARFRGCKQLTQLTLTNLHITDAGLENFNGCKAIIQLSISAKQVTDAGFANFKDCSGLHRLDLFATQVGDKSLSIIKNFTNLQHPWSMLRLDRTQVTDAGLGQLATLPRLRVLKLRGAKVSEVGVKRLAAALPDCTIDSDYGTFGPQTPVADAPASSDPNRRAAEWVLSIGGTISIAENGNERYVAAVGDLPRGAFEFTGLILSGKKVSDAGLAHFKDCKSMKRLHLHSTQVSDAGLVNFKECKNMGQLILAATQVSDAGLVHFKNCKNLNYLNLGYTKVSDEGLAHFKDCKNLMYIELVGTRVGDAGLVHFKDCKNLTHFILKNTKVSAAGIADLKKALPQCRIEWDGGVIEPARYTNSLGMQFALVPRGKAWLGGGGGKPGDKEVEFKDDFYLGVYEVTREEWQTVMGVKFQKLDKRNPVERVSWDACQQFLGALNALTRESGWVYRLPTEQEWEYACRGGPMTDKFDGAFDFYFDKPVHTLAPGMANFAHGEGSLKRVCNVGMYKPNRLGLYDMHGNVMEWCQDEAPPDPKDAKALPRRVLRGGSWWVLAEHCRAGAISRAPHDPTWKEHIGLRVARVRAPVADTSGSPDADRRAAEWVLSIGGALRINGEEDGIKSAFDLPREPFRLTVVDLDLNKQVSTPGLASFEGCKNLTELYLRATGVSNAGLAYFKDCKKLTKLRLIHTGVGDTGLVHFKDCKDLTYLSLGGSQVTDKGLSYFADCKNLTEIHIGLTRVGDAGLGHLQACTKLKDVNLSNTKVTDAGLAHLKDCKELTNLDLRGTKVSDTGLEHVQHCKNLMHLDLTGTKVTGGGLVHLKNCKQLSSLGLRAPQLGDTGLKHVGEYKSLARLYLDGTQVTDAGLAHLKDLRALELLSLKGTTVTSEGVKKVATGLPKCRIEWDGGVIEPRE